MFNRNCYLVFSWIILVIHITIGQEVQMVIAGSLTIAHDGETIPEAGTIRWNCFDYEVWNGTEWVSLTRGDQSQDNANNISGIPSTFGVSIADLAINQENNLYAVGYFDSIGIIGPDTLMTSGGQDIYIAKYDPSGNLLWTKKAGGPKLDVAIQLVFDQNNDFYITGSFTDEANFENQVLLSEGSSDIFLAKYNSNGNLIWVRSAGGSGNDQGTCLAVNATGDIHMAGRFSGVAYFENDSTGHALQQDIFISKYSELGNLIWVEHNPGQGTEYPSSIAVDQNNDIYLTGNFNGNMHLGSSSLFSNGSGDIFLAKYNQNGGTIWAKGYGGVKFDQGISLALDSAGQLLLAASFQDSLNMESNPLVSNGLTDFMIAKFSKLGNLIWVTKEGGQLNDYIGEIQIDPKNHIHAIGSFSLDAFDHLEYAEPNQGLLDIFVLEYDHSGTLRGYKTSGGVDMDQGRAIALGTDQSIIIAGSYRSPSISWGAQTLITTGGRDQYIFRYRP